MHLNHKLYGQGDPLIILHGLFGSLDNWATFGRTISEDFMTYLIDQRDHGKSPHTNAFNYELLSHDLLHFMEENWIHHASVMGHSMGGKTAMKLALEHRDIVEKLIVVDMAPKAYTNRHQDVFNAMKAVQVESLENRHDAQDILLEKLDGDTATAGFLLKNIKREKDGSFSWKMNVSLLEREYNHIVAAMPTNNNYDGPTLFIRGGNSNYILPEDEPLIKQLFPQAEIQTIEGAGHWVHAEKPNKLLAMVKEFLQRN